VEKTMTEPTDPKQPDKPDPMKPTFTLLTQPFTVERIVAFFETLTGRKATAEEVQECRDAWEKEDLG